MRTVKMYMLEDNQWKVAGWTTYNNIGKFVTGKDAFIGDQPGYSIIELIDGGQAYITNQDADNVKEYFNEVIC